MCLIRRLSSVLVAVSLLATLPGCLSPRWARPVNPLLNDDTDRGRAALQARDYVMALEFYGRLADEDPENMEARFHLAQINQELGRMDDAYSLYRIVYMSAADGDAPRLNGMESDEPLYLAAERNLVLLGARMSKADPELRQIQEERARKRAEEEAEKSTLMQVLKSTFGE